MQAPRITTILIATDLLAGSHLALDYAVAFARHFNAKIIMVHALELSYPAREVEMTTHLPSLTRKHVQERINVIADGVRTLGVEVEIFLEEGIPAEVIPSAVQTHAADLLVMGVYGTHRGLTHLLVGSNTEKILLSATCPTMTVGAHVLAGADPRLHFKEILYFSDLTAEAAAAAPYAAFLSGEFDAPVDVCRLLPDEAAEYDSRQREGLPHDQAETSIRLDHDREIDELIARAKSQHAGLIVLGVHAESMVERHLHTSFVYRLLSEATCPVISVLFRDAIGP
jgi:nucleotide-binding universal stress UspA family protein